MIADLDIVGNRALPKWTRWELAGRFLWALAMPLFRLSPRPLWGWRRALLRAFGARIGADVHIYPTAQIAIPWNLEIGPYAAVGDRVILYALGPIKIESRASISQGAHLCAGTHDHRRANLPLIKATIVIGEGAWICADAFIGPDVKVGSYAIVGARGVAMRDVADWAIVVGNPAKVVGRRSPPIAP